VLGKTAARHTSAEFVAFLIDIVANQPRGKEIHVIADNLSAHKSQPVKDFLEAHRKVQLHVTPTYSSWLNQVELWFSKIERDVIAIDGNYLASSPPTTISWSSSAVSNGSHTISAKAYSSSGSNIGASTVTVSVSNGSGGGGGGSAHFSTLPPGSSLPSGDQCASMVRFSSFEPRPDNYTANHTVPSDLSGIRGSAGALASFIDRVDGNFTGTTDEILQWGACKWGFDEDLVRAIAQEESGWRQPAAGDFTYNTSQCPSGAVYSGGGCYQTYGIMQIKAPDFIGTFPSSTQSTAFAVDYKLAYQRACYEGQVSYLSGLSSDYPSGSSYDMLWGCVDQWLTGGWWSGSDDWYLSDIKGFISNKPWLSPNF
jgi:autotransporter family porin